jgi:hypothetical protein
VIVACTSSSKSTKQKKYLRPFFEVLGMSLALRNPGNGRNTWLTSLSVASAGTPNNQTVNVEAGCGLLADLEELEQLALAPAAVGLQGLD